MEPLALGGSRVSKPRTAFNKMVTFLVSGLWHGANMTFVIWGGVHGAAQVGEDVLKIKKSEKHNLYWVIRVICVFVFVMAGWVFFRASSFHDALYVFGNMFDGVGNIGTYMTNGFSALDINRNLIVRIVLLYLVALAVYYFISLK